MRAHSPCLCWYVFQQRLHWHRSDSVDMLEQHRLPVPAAYIRKHANIPSLETYAQQEGMTHIVHCSRCQKSTGSLEDIGSGKEFWWCKKCRMSAKRCGICREGVIGLWMGCGKCHHGGHQRCMRLYYSEFFQCLPQAVTTICANSRSVDPEIVPSADKPSLPQSSSNGSSGLQRTISVQGGSYDSSGYVKRPRTSGETNRDSLVGKEGDLTAGWNVCPTGCGCRCRGVVAPSIREPD